MVFDAIGRRAATITTDERQASGPHTLTVPTLRPGLYTVRLQHDGTAEYRKLVVE
jgi:hypothetical protein